MLCSSTSPVVHGLRFVITTETSEADLESMDPIAKYKTCVSCCVSCLFFDAFCLCPDTWRENAESGYGKLRVMRCVFAFRPSNIHQNVLD